MYPHHEMHFSKHYFILKDYCCIVCSSNIWMVVVCLCGSWSLQCAISSKGGSPTHVLMITLSCVIIHRLSNLELLLLDVARAVHRASYHLQFALMNAPVSTSY